MARRMSDSALITFNIAPLSGYTAGPITIAALLKRNTLTPVHTPVKILTSGFSNRVGIALNAFRLNLGAGGGSSAFGTASTSVWWLVVATWAGGAAANRFHVHDGTSWAHADQTSGTSSNQTIAASDGLHVGGVSSGTGTYDVVCAGIKKADRTDLQVETLSPLFFQTWRDFGFDWLVGFDASLTISGAYQDQASPGTGDEVSKTGTSTVVSDPAGWAWTGSPAVTPVADFTGTPLTGTAPLNVAFTDTSTNVPTSWAWTFGDGGTSSAQNPTHNYTVPGTYTVTLVATNSAGSNTKTRTGYVTVGGPPVADFTGTPLTGARPLSVAFTDTSTSAPTSWAWTFGDGGTSSAQNPTHSYTVAGTYTVTLVATNTAGSNTKTRTAYVTVANPSGTTTRIKFGDGLDVTDEGAGVIEVNAFGEGAFLSGTGAPTSGVGSNGAFYLDKTTGKIYGPKAAGAWPATATGRLVMPGNTYNDVLATYSNYAALLAG